MLLLFLPMLIVIPFFEVLKFQWLARDVFIVKILDLYAPLHSEDGSILVIQSF